MSQDLSNSELRWPAPLFASEGERVLRSSHRSWEEQAVWLLTEALAGTTAVADFEDLPNHPAPSDVSRASTTPGWDTRHGMDKRNWLTELVHGASELRRAAEPRPYWPQRQGRGTDRRHYWLFTSPEPAPGPPPPIDDNWVPFQACFGVRMCSQQCWVLPEL